MRIVRFLGALRRGVIKRIHVNQFEIRKGAELPLRVKTSKKNYPAASVEIMGPSEVVYRPDSPLSCGAKCWVETTAEVRVLPVPAESYADFDAMEEEE